jgi:succinate-semialdehyde dehydrogenase/glutarate-semialdehyde dehydrogenase
MRIFREEIFAPIIPLYSYTDENELLELINLVEQGLAGYFYTNDLKRLFKFSERIECGMIGVNTGLISAENAPFGGIKFSGFGKEGSKYGIHEYINRKYICIDLS